MELTLHNGDCLEIMKAIPDKSVDLIICDLPYGCLTGGGGKEKAKRQEVRSSDVIAGCPWDIKIDLEAFWKQVKRIRRSEHSPTIHFCTTKFGYDLIKSNPDEFRYDLVWDKQRGVSFLSANKMPMRSHEMIYVFSKAGAFYERKDFAGTPYKTSGNSPGHCYQKHNTGKSEPKTVSTRCVLSVVKPPQYMDFKSWVRTRPDDTTRKSTQYGALRTDTEGGDGKRCVLSVVKPPQYMTFKKWNVNTDREINTQTYNGGVSFAPTNKEGGDGKRCVLSVVEHPGSVKKGNHPTEKPEALYKFLIERYCPLGGMVLDPTFGSGNSVFTAFAMGRSAIGIEQDETFFKKAEERLNALP